MPGSLPPRPGKSSFPAARYLLAAKLRRSNVDASKGSVEEIERIVTQIRQTWRTVRIILRADSGFAREELMAWCEQNRVDYVFGLARRRHPRSATRPPGGPVLPRLLCAVTAREGEHDLEHISQTC